MVVTLGLALVLPPMGCRHADAGTALRIEVPDADRDADLYVDGNYVGQVGTVGKDPVGPVMLAPGVHRVEVRKPGRFPVQRTVRVDADTPAETVIDAELLEDPQ
ncbi:PEGA domain-containing protein [Paraliomyxa miuraensis]|uniref:PEGA domain-containing protein n=1 Tax=Paraliomyxa miuraensis TaxID=376150 RepID=UPI0022536FDF|nr:PEGA domain-containing protein [Paraliomyxa miuraensis]MCX4245911.1 PEGA domain-containing protein [Paraliomyxa miuraensis]